MIDNGEVHPSEGYEPPSNSRRYLCPNVGSKKSVGQGMIDWKGFASMLRWVKCLNFNLPHAAAKDRLASLILKSFVSAGASKAPARTRGEPRPKGPTIKAERLREGNAGHDVCAKERQE